MSEHYAFVFPGQGSQSVGMGFSIAAKYPDFEVILNEILREADAALGFSLSSIIQNGPAEKLKETEVTQPALLTVSTAIDRWLKKRGFKATVALGHSLGEYSALVHAGAVSFHEAVKLVQLRGQLMASAVPSGQGSMAALIGATRESASALCAAAKKLTGEVLEPSAFNCPGQVVISGTVKAVDTAIPMVKEFGIRAATKLEVSGPFHCSLLKGAGEKLGEALAKIEITSPSTPVVANTTAEVEDQPAKIRQNLIDQVSRAVRWQESIEKAAQKFGVKKFIEVGSGKVLSGLIRKIIPDSECVAIETIEPDSPLWN